MLPIYRRSSDGRTTSRVLRRSRSRLPSRRWRDLRVGVQCVGHRDPGEHRIGTGLTTFGAEHARLHRRLPVVALVDLVRQPGDVAGRLAQRVESRRLAG
jgi:hypothetical protein